MQKKKKKMLVVIMVETENEGRRAYKKAFAFLFVLF